MTHPDDTVPMEKLEAILAGLEWLPAGPWTADDNEADLLSGSGRWVTLDHGNYVWRHIARLDPDTVRSIITELLARRAPATQKLEAVVWACTKCNSPRSIDPCPKCGTPLEKPADGWHWPTLPDVDRIRALAREVGYAVGVHGSLERDLDLIAAPWVETAVSPAELAQHIADGLGGRVVDFEHQDKPCGRWSCNIHTPDWTKMIDLSVMPPIRIE